METEEKYNTMIDATAAPPEAKAWAKSQCFTWKLLTFGLPVTLQEYEQATGGGLKP